MNPEEEKTLRQELLQRCKSAIGFDGITQCGETPPSAEKPWYIKRDGQDIYLTLEEAQEYLENLTQEHKPSELWELVDGPKED
jgi:hypothetical protein